MGFGLVSGEAPWLFLGGNYQRLSCRGGRVSMLCAKGGGYCKIASNLGPYIKLLYNAHGKQFP